MQMAKQAEALRELVDKLDTIKRLENAGALAIVMHSLFEEQIVS
jgi:hypothetical protein